MAPNSFLVVSLVIASSGILFNRIEGIAYGRLAKEGQFPYQLLLESSVDANTFCGGVLINVKEIQAVLTTLTCLEGQDIKFFTVRAGDLKRNESSTFGQQRRVTWKAYLYNDFDQEEIAVYGLNEPFMMTKYVAPIPLPEQGQMHNGSLIASGWGAMDELNVSDRSNDLLWNNLEINDERCKESGCLLCTYEGNNNGTCKGDNAGPIVSVSGGYVAGLIVNGGGCQQGTSYGSHCNLAHFATWIEDAVILMENSFQNGLITRMHAYED